MKKHTQNRALKVQQIVAKHYQPDRQDRCKLWVYRNFIEKEYNISERTFWRYLAVKEKKNKKY